MDSIPSQSYGNLITDHDLERFDHELPLPLPEMDIHGALLMQLLDDMPLSTDECEDERLDFVIRSLEAEIGSDLGLVGDGESITGPNDDHGMDSDEGSGLEDIEYDFDKYDDESRTTTMAYYAYHEFDMDVAAAAAMGPAPAPAPAGGEQLYVTCDDDHQDVQFGERLGFYNFGTGAYNYNNYVGDHDHQYACVEQVYSPLWQ